MEISLCMIVKNEEEALPRCLECVTSFIDEIILVDTGSTDHTKEIGAKYNAKIFDFKWCDNFGKARNYAFDQATKDYIMWLDADDYITQDNIAKIVSLKTTLDSTIDSVSMHYSLGRDALGNTATSLRRNRIVKRKKAYKWIGCIHEYLEVTGNVYPADIYIHHDKHKTYTDRNLKIYRKMQEENISMSPRDLYYFANELYYNNLFEEAIRQYITFLDTDGWVEDKKIATSNLIQCFTATNQPEMRINAILESFKWTKPRADICCRLADYFLEKEAYQDAVFWYKVAMMCTPEKGTMSLDLKDYYTWIPAIQLCVCFSHLGDYYMAYYYNELCSKLGGNTIKVLHNRDFLTSQFEQEGLPIPEFDIILVDKSFK